MTSTLLPARTCPAGARRFAVRSLGSPGRGVSRSPDATHHAHIGTSALAFASNEARFGAFPSGGCSEFQPFRGDCLAFSRGRLGTWAGRPCESYAVFVAGAGTVTLLFTDLVGSTELLVALGEDRYDSVRDEHEMLVAGTIAEHHGEIVKSTGDGYMGAFARAGDAVGAAAEIQRLIAKRNEDSEVVLGIRIGISAGDVTTRAGDYEGVTAVEAARLCAAATGGQVLASETVRSLVGSRGGYDFVALGEVDLKGLPPLATAAVRWGDDAPVFAPSGDAKGNLPASLDRFVGRERDLVAIRALLAKGRLITLTGPGGSGKTRLALEAVRAVGAERRDGVWLVDLAPVDDEKLIAGATMAALGLRAGHAPARDELRSHLARRDTLLLLDNCEHVLDGVARLVTDLLGACPRMRVLATSRQPLGVPGEAEYPVQGLEREEAVALFAERVPGQRRIDNPHAIERICAALEGSPLAIELAAAKLRVLSPAELADRLNDQLGVLARGRRTAPERQRTLRATLDWSYDLLDGDERTVFRRLGIFAGSFTPGAAEQVVADDQMSGARVIDLLEQLVERSLLTMVPGASHARFRLLEPVRQYAAERLGEAGERDALAQCHLDWVMRFAGEALVEFFASQRESTVRISQEHPNVCQALEFTIAHGDSTSAATIIEALGYPWFTAGQPDGRLWCERVLAVVSADAPALTRAGVLVATGAMRQGALQYDAGRELLLEARDLYRSAKDVLGEALTLTWLGRDAFFRSHASTEAQTLFEEALSRYREKDFPAGAGWCLTFLAQVALAGDDDDLARQRAEEAVHLGRTTHIGQIVGEGLHVLAMLDSRAGEFETADRRLAEMIAISEAAGDRLHHLLGHASATEVAAAHGDVARAASHLAAGSELARELPSSEATLEFILSAAYVAYLDGRADDAAVLFGARLGLSPLTIPKRFRPIVEALEKQGLREDINAGKNLNADKALERVADLVSSQSSLAPQ
jgi:predicted ATPase/class 3 adenylate cyclase